MKSLGKHKRPATTHSYEDQLKTKIGRYAAKNGSTHAMEKFSTELGWSVPESNSLEFQASLPYMCKGSHQEEGPESSSFVRRA